MQSLWEENALDVGCCWNSPERENPDSHLFKYLQCWDMSTKIFSSPSKKTWRNTLCCIFIPLTSPMSQLISYWLMQNLEPSGEINTTILTVCRLRTGKSTCGKKNDFFLQSWRDVTSSCQQFHFNQHVHQHVKMWNKCRWRLQSPFLDLVNQSAQACPEKLSNS